MSTIAIDGYLFDVQHSEDNMLLWVKTKDDKIYLLYDKFQPSIYVHGDSSTIEKLSRRLQVLGVLASAPQWRRLTHFYSGNLIDVLCYTFSKPSFLKVIHRKLYAFFERIEIYHSDIEIETLYLLEKNLTLTEFVHFTCESIIFQGQNVFSVISATSLRIENENQFEYSLPSFRVMKLSLSNSHRLNFDTAILQLQYNDRYIELHTKDAITMIESLNEFVSQNDPDIILSDYGDRTILPSLYRKSKELNIPLLIDRLERRRFVTESVGRSYFTYGSIIFRANSFHLNGRWHIDSQNSFVHRESGLEGLIQLSRLSNIPVQRMARSSTGAAMTAIQTATAIKLGYLVPWQKSHSEERRLAIDLLVADKGGLVYEPDIQTAQIYHNVVQIDFSQMYPTIMVKHNVSPETVFCSCCAPQYMNVERVPEIGFPVCRRRKGIVPLSIAPILKLRQYYKSKKKSAPTQQERFRATQRSDSLKWLLVTCFGYLGYRNAKFGRLESHESVTAYGRQKLLLAKQISESSNYRLLHAITDSLFLEPIKNSSNQSANNNVNIQTSPDSLQSLCDRISQATDVEMSLEGVYSWVVFLTARKNDQLPVANRYFGRFYDGSMKVRGILVRRRDTATFIKDFQQSLLALLATATNKKEIELLLDSATEIYFQYEQLLIQKKVDFQHLLLRRTMSRSMNDYIVNGPSKSSLEQLSEIGIQVEPGEKIRYLLIRKNGRKYYLAEERINSDFCDYDVEAYRLLLIEAFRELWSPFATPSFFAELKDRQHRLF